jgi:hypothetical protein
MFALAVVLSETHFIGPLRREEIFSLIIFQFEKKNFVVIPLINDILFNS